MLRPSLVEKVITSLLETPGETAIPLRRAVFEQVRTCRDGVPENVAALVEKIAGRPWTVTDDDILQVREAGYSEDQIYELVLAAAAGAGVRRLDAGLRAIKEAE
jgi:alkylhydroperoxidase family enzyme